MRATMSLRVLPVLLALMSLCVESQGKSVQSHKLVKRQAMKNTDYRWTNNVIPWRVDGDFTDEEIVIIKEGFKAWNDHTCLKFQQTENNTEIEENNIRIMGYDRGCFSSFGMDGGEQVLNLAHGGCVYPDFVMHEAGHAIGLFHEHTRPDRDNFIDIKWENIQNNHYAKDQFKLQNGGKISSYGFPYDKHSIMQYAPWVFSGNNKDTMVSKTRGNMVDNMFEGKGYLSFIDIALVNTMYKCNEKCEQRFLCPDGGYQKGPSHGCKCYCPTGEKHNPEKVCDRQPTKCSNSPGCAGLAKVDPEMCYDDTLSWKCPKKCKLCH